MITEELRRFILTSIPSIPHLEALLLVRRDSTTDWDAASLARRLYIPEKTAEAVITELAAAGFVARREGTNMFFYQPAMPEQAAIVDQLAAVYAHDLVAVTNLIHGRSALLFADAFRIRRE